MNELLKLLEELLTANPNLNDADLFVFAREQAIALGLLQSVGDPEDPEQAPQINRFVNSIVSTAQSNIAKQNTSIRVPLRGADGVPLAPFTTPDTDTSKTIEDRRREAENVRSRVWESFIGRQQPSGFSPNVRQFVDRQFAPAQASFLTQFDPLSSETNPQTSFREFLETGGNILNSEQLGEQFIDLNSRFNSPNISDRDRALQDILTDDTVFNSALGTLLSGINPTARASVARLAQQGFDRFRGEGQDTGQSFLNFLASQGGRLFQR